MKQDNIIVRLITRLVAAGHELEFQTHSFDFKTEIGEPRMFKGFSVENGIMFLEFDDGSKLNLNTFNESSLCLSDVSINVERVIDEDGNFVNESVESKNLFTILPYVI